MKRDAEFLRKVTEIASKNNMSATAKALKIPVYTLKARLLSATMKLGKIPPQFAKTRVVKKVRITVSLFIIGRSCSIVSSRS